MRLRLERRLTRRSMRAVAAEGAAQRRIGVAREQRARGLRQVVLQEPSAAGAEAEAAEARLLWEAVQESAVERRVAAKARAAEGLLLWEEEPD